MNVVKVFLVLGFISFNSLSMAAGSQALGNAPPKEETHGEQPETAPHSLCFSEEQWKNLLKTAGKKDQTKVYYLFPSEQWTLFWETFKSKTSIREIILREVRVKCECQIEETDGEMKFIEMSGFGNSMKEAMEDAAGACDVYEKPGVSISLVEDSCQLNEYLY